MNDEEPPSKDDSSDSPVRLTDRINKPDADFWSAFLVFRAVNGRGIAHSILSSSYNVRHMLNILYY